MKDRTLIIFAAVLALLVGAYAIRRAMKTKPGAPPAASAKLCAGLDVSDVTGLSLWNNEKRNEKRVELDRKGGAWVVASSFGHPAKDVEEFIRTFIDLKGEVRSTSKDVLGSYEIKDDQGTHVEFRGKGDHHLVIGKKSPGSQESFVRRANSSDVYLVRETFGDPLDAKRWLDLGFISMEGSNILGITLESPCRKLVFEREAKDKDWKLVDPALPFKLKDGDVDALASLHISAEEAADPATFGAPTRKATFKLEGGATTSFEFADQLARKAGAAHAYKLRDGSLDRIFVKMKDLAEIKPLEIDAATVTRVTIDDPWKTVALERKDGAWTSPGLELKGTEFLKGLFKLDPDDVATPPTTEDAAPPDAEYRAVISAGDAVHTIVVGRAVPGAKDTRFLKVIGQGETYAVTASTIDRLFPPLSDIANVKRLEVGWKQGTELTLKTGDLVIALRQTPAGWDALVDGFAFPVKSGQLDTILGYNVTPNDVVTKKTLDKPEFEWSDGKLTLGIGPKEGDRRLVKWGDAHYRIGWSIDDLCVKFADLVDLKPFARLASPKSATLGETALVVSRLKELTASELAAPVELKDPRTLTVELDGASVKFTVGGVEGDATHLRISAGGRQLVVAAADVEKLEAP